MVGQGSAAGRTVWLVRTVAGPLVLGVALLLALLHGHSTGATGLRPTVLPTQAALVRCHVLPGTAASSQARGEDTLAVVRTPGGEVRVVSFEEGWEVYNGRAPGIFLRVCRA